jgi:peptidoglycan hydrolase-like protein with peptidoglycan-binding domain
MEKVNLQEGNAALERVLLMMKYDMNKTLNENKGVISEQEQPKGYRNIVVTYLNPGTDEARLVKGFKELSKVDDFVTLNDYFKKKHKGNDLQSVLNSELGTGDAQTAKEIQDHLKSIGVTMTFMVSSDKKGVVDDTIRITFSGEQPKKGKSPFACLSKIAQYKIGPGKYRMGKGVYFLNRNGKYGFTSDQGLKKTGTWRCDEQGFVEMDGQRTNVTPKKQWVTAPTEEEVKTGKKVLKSGMMGEFVGKVQNQLKAKGINPGTADKKFGNNTKNAIIKFQETVGLKPDGVVGKNTYQQLFFEVPKVEPTNVTPQGETPQGQTPAEQPGLNPVFEPKAPEIQRQQVQAPALTQRQQRQANRMARRQQNAHVDPQPTLKESVKGKLKKTLVEKEQEKKNILIETKIINNRFNILAEGRLIESDEDQINLVEDIIVEMNYMVSQGYTSKVINEGLFSFLGGLFGDSVKSVPAIFGEYIAKWLTKTLGIPEGSFMQSAIMALVGNLNISDYDKFFTDCRFASNKIADSLIEGYLIQMQQKSQATSQGASGFVTSALRNAVSEYFLEEKDGIIQKLQDMIGDFICPKLGKMTSVMGDVASNIKDKVVS